jgi:hypothetical protein
MQSFKSLKLTVSFSLAMLIAICGVADAQQLPGVKCIVDGQRQCKTKHAVPLGGGEVFFSSQSAAKRFTDLVLGQQTAKANPQRDAWVLRANHQLALTGQYRQCRCVITGDAIGESEQVLNESVSTAVAGLRIYFKDAAAKEKLLAKKSLIDRVKIVFASNQFAKNFALAEVKNEGNVRSIADRTIADRTIADRTHAGQSINQSTTKK